jgi:hypothetical protein
MWDLGEALGTLVEWLVAASVFGAGCAVSVVLAFFGVTGWPVLVPPGIALVLGIWAARSL